MDQELLALAGRLIAVPGYTELPDKETRVAETLCAALQEMGLLAQLRDYLVRLTQKLNERQEGGAA